MITEDLVQVSDVEVEKVSDKEKREWYVLHTRSRHENVTYEGLLRKKIEVFLPIVRMRSKRRDRKVMINVPLFPGYLFVKTDLEPHRHIEIVKTFGAVRLVGNQDGPLSVSDENIKSLQIMVQNNEAISTGRRRFRRGTRIMVVNGPFTGVSGIFVQYKGIGRVVVYIDVLGQYAAVDVDEDDIEILPEILL